MAYVDHSDGSALTVPELLARIQHLEATISKRDRKIKELKTQLGINDAGWRPPPLGLTQRQVEIFRLLMRRPIVSNDDFERAFKNDNRTEWLSNVWSVQISYMRRLLKPHGIEIANVRREGYLISDAGKARARKLMGWTEAV